MCYCVLCILVTAGVGCSQQFADNWTAHQEDFNSVLSALNKDVTTESSVAAFSLNDKSKNSRSRVQYVSLFLENCVVFILRLRKLIGLSAVVASITIKFKLSQLLFQPFTMLQYVLYPSE